MKKAIINLGVVSVVVLIITGCMADVRTIMVKKDGISVENEKKGEAILEKTWEKHGFDKLKDHENYSFKGKDVWKGMMGKMGKLWPDAESEMNFKYEVGSFNGQVSFVDGKRKGEKAGLQSWNYYEINGSGDTSQVDMNERIRFGLSAFQYFFEILDRMKNAPIITYGGEKSVREKVYDVVFVTWESVTPHDEHDQYQLLVNQETGMLDFVIYTLRENYLKMPGSKMFHGSMEFGNYKVVDDIMIPHKQTVYLNDPKKKMKKHIHQLEVSEFKFDNFETQDLFPFKEIENTGDSKEQG